MKSASLRNRDAWIVFGFALVVRIAVALDALDAPFWRIAILDEQAYLDLAERLRTHTPLPHGAWYVAPGYAYVLAGLSALGTGPMLAKLVNLLAGVASAVLVWRMTRAVAGRQSAILAACLWSLYPAALLQELLVLKSALTVLAVLLGLAFLMPEPRDRGDPQSSLPPASQPLRWLAAGACFGAACLLRGELLIASVILALAGWVHASRRSPASPPPLGPAVFLLVVALAVSVPTIQNARWSGDPVLVAFGGGTNFYIGNHPAADGGYVPLRPDRFDPLQEESDAVLLASRGLGRTASPGEVSRYWCRRGFAWWKARPLDAAELTLKKLALLWGPYELADAYATPLAGRWVLLLRNPLVGPWLIFPASLAGLWMTRRRHDLWPLRAFVLGASFSIVPFFLFERFRLHLVAACVPFASVAAERAVELVRSRRFGRLATGCAATLAVGAALALARAPRDEIVLRVNLGEMLRESGRFDEALREFEAVRAASPDSWRVEINIANTEIARGHNEAALAALERVLARLHAEGEHTGLPSAEELVYCHELAGDLERERGQLGAAARHYEAALQYAPPDAQPALRAKLATCRIEEPYSPGGLEK